MRKILSLIIIIFGIIIGAILMLFGVYCIFVAIVDFLSGNTERAAIGAVMSFVSVIIGVSLIFGTLFNKKIMKIMSGEEYLIEKTFAGWRIEFDREATREAFTKLPVGSGCDCKTCRNFLKAVESFPKEVVDFFNELGVDLMKPSETYGSRGIQDINMQYGGWYHIVGKYLSGEDIWQPAKEPKPVKWLDITDDFAIGFTRNKALVPNGFPEPVLQMEINFSVPWVLEEPYR
ncbi:MAG: hypothetical protein FWG90_03910 [Oscillospiraceae bacterium]|nr:hypothetical protein [Oscillospiraceae bacterium]